MSLSYFINVFTSISINFSAVEIPIIKKDVHFLRFGKNSVRAAKKYEIQLQKITKCPKVEV